MDSGWDLKMGKDFDGKIKASFMGLLGGTWIFFFQCLWEVGSLMEMLARYEQANVKEFVFLF